ncbi:hypothetical protein J2W91_004654 [Paenibacillus amylolyticus]|uniref:Uncharacterized protein n=1 Tax=Paenibacillus amylolyticus TaxID=1451 RepID=A0AAP5H7F2_PAEAM|nr:hypothetical protein [Paenibacillus amylolyticus]
MMGGLIACVVWIGMILGIASIALGFGEGARGNGRYNWSKVINKKLCGGVFIVIVCAYWLYR